MSQPIFSFESLKIYGEGKETAIVNFKPGINFIVGPSNTGKSLIVNSIDYVFGYIPDKKHPHYTLETLTFNGYNKISLTLNTSNGTVILTRVINTNKINISGTDSNFDKGDFSIKKDAKNSVQPILLKLLGVEGNHSVIKSEKGNTADISFRSFIHFSLIRQNNITHVPSIYINPDAVSFSLSSSPALLLFLLNGIDSKKMLDETDPKIIKARKKAVAEYIRIHLDNLSKRKEELSALPLVSELDSQQLVSSIEHDIQAIQSVIDNSISESQSVMNEIYSINTKRSELNTIRNSFQILKSQYQTDIDRLDLIIQGKNTEEAENISHICPFCNNQITDDNTESIMTDEILINLQHIKNHLAELVTTDSDISKQYDDLTKKVEELETKKKTIDDKINNELKPRLSKLKQQIIIYKNASQINCELEIINQEETRLLNDLSETEAPVDKIKIDIKTQYTADIITPLKDKISDVLKDIKFPGYNAVKFNLDTFDIMIGSQTKAGCQGGGCIGVINSAMIIALMEHLIENGKYTPGYCILDSPLTMLSESKYKDELFTIKLNFIKYILENKTNGQIILVEQYEKLESILNDIQIKKNKHWENVNVIEYTGDLIHGPYGLLPGVTNPGT